MVPTWKPNCTSSYGLQSWKNLQLFIYCELLENNHVITDCLSTSSAGFKVNMARSPFEIFQQRPNFQLIIHLKTCYLRSLSTQYMIRRQVAVCLVFQNPPKIFAKLPTIFESLLSDLGIFCYLRQSLEISLNIRRGSGDSQSCQLSVFYYY